MGAGCWVRGGARRRTTVAYDGGQTETLWCRYSARACDLTFERGNAFILPHHEGRYDRVHVGGLCDADRLPTLLRLLRPGTGRLVVPCNSELLCLTRSGNKVRCSTRCPWRKAPGDIWQSQSQGAVATRDRGGGSSLPGTCAVMNELDSGLVLGCKGGCTSRPRQLLKTEAPSEMRVLVSRIP